MRKVKLFIVLGIINSFLQVKAQDNLMLNLNAQNPSCDSVCNGSVMVEATGGQPPYSYAWFNGLVSDTYPNACAGPGDVTVLDAGGKFATIAFTLIGQNSIIIDDIFVQEPSCGGACDGVIVVTASGGSPPFAYSLSEGSQGELCAGEYTITVTDANGCSSVGTAIIVDPSPFEINDIIVTQPSDGQNNGSITILVFGGSAPIQYSLNCLAYTPSNVFVGLGPGVYIVCIKDANGCVTQEEVVLEDLSAVNELNVFFRIYPNPVLDKIHIDFDIPLAVELLNLEGKRIAQESFKTDHEITMTDFPGGMYVLKISDGENCAYRKIVKSRNEH